MGVYRVGGHLFALEVEDSFLSGKELNQYAPFRADCCSGDELLFTLRVTADRCALPAAAKVMAQWEDENGGTTLSEAADGGMIVGLSTPRGAECCRVWIGADYRTATAWTGGTEGERRYGLDTAAMMVYAFASARRDTLLVHASAVEYAGKGYLFLGKSGTGKSTHSRLWLETDAEVRLLNDDNPVVRVAADGRVYAYGSPWSGKTACYRNHIAELGGIVRLRQAPENRITELSAVKAYAAVLPSCSCMKWDRAMAEGVHRTISRVIGSTGVYLLECRPDREAAAMCRKSITCGKP